MSFTITSWMTMRDGLYHAFVGEDPWAPSVCGAFVCTDFVPEPGGGECAECLRGLTKILGHLSESSKADIELELSERAKTRKE